MQQTRLSLVRLGFERGSDWRGAVTSPAPSTPAVLAQERQRAAEAQAELLKVEVQAKAVPVELDAARAAESAARAQLERQQEGEGTLPIFRALVVANAPHPSPQNTTGARQTCATSSTS